MTRTPRILHCASEPLHFFGRQAELALLDASLDSTGPSLVALLGPGGQGKTAIVQHWLQRLVRRVDGLFFWSFYRGKDVDRCLREWLAYAEGLPAPPEVSAAWCVDRLLETLHGERWAVVLDGAEVVQYEEGPWRGRFIHPDLGRLLEEVGSEAMPGLVVLTTRFELPTLSRRPFVRLVQLDRLDPVSARHLLLSLGVTGAAVELDAVAEAAGRHAKAVELLGTYLTRFQGGRPEGIEALPGAPGPIPAGSRPDHRHEAEARGESDEESSVARVLAAFQQALPAEEQDVLVLATAFRDPPTTTLLLDYLTSPAVDDLLHGTWGRCYAPLGGRGRDWLAAQVDELVHLRLLERVGAGPVPVIDAHPLVRRGFEHLAGPAGQRQNALARAGFLRGRPDRRRPANLEQARPEIELFHAHCQAGLWSEADSTLVALENPKHRFLAPALELDLLLCFFPARDWRQPPRWPGFGRWRSLAICLEMLGRFDDALDAYPPADAPLRGDALLALGRLRPLLDMPLMPAPWQTLWQAYRCHALCLAGRTAEAVALARSLVPIDVYEWVHVSECLLRAGRLDAIDARALSACTGQHRWADLARRRLLAELRRGRGEAGADLDEEYTALLEAFERAGLVWEQALTRLGRAAWRSARGDTAGAHGDADAALALARRYRMAVVEADALERLAVGAEEVRAAIGYHGPGRP